MTTSGSGNGPFVLVDGTAYLYRAFHALPPLTNSKGEPTGAVYGVVNMLKKLLREYDTDRVAVVFDAPGKTFRDELYSEYKATRPPMPDDLRVQIDPLLATVEALGLPVLRVPGVEADDVIGTLSREASGRGFEVVISTADKDMAQLVEKGVTLVNTMSGSTLDRAGVKKKFDVFPEQIIDYLALVGDTSDNIPGVPKVGPKTAAKWLNEYETLDSIVEHADEIKGKVGESLRDNLEQLELSRKLASIRCDVELDTPLDALVLRAPDRETLTDVYRNMEFGSLLRALRETQAKTEPAAPEAQYETVLTEGALDQWIDKLANAPLIAIDTETDSLDYMRARLVGVSFSVDIGSAAYVPVAHDYPGAPDQLAADLVLAKLKPILEDTKKNKVGHHIKYDAHIFLRYGINLAGIRYDTMLESYVLNSTATRHDMDSIAEKYLGLTPIKYEEVTGRGAKQIGFNQVALEQAGPYAAEDADITLRLHEKLWPQLENTPSLETLFEDIERPLIGVLTRMEETGVLLDTDLLSRLSREFADKMHEFETKAHEVAGGPFNIGSPKQLQEILFDKLGLPVLRKTPKGQPSTAEDVLAELAEDYQLPRLVLDYRALQKLKSTYTDTLPREVNPNTGRVHTSYHQAVAVTGRLASSDPNLQNIPVRNAEGRRIRQAFIAPDGYRLLAADYSQIELRIMAHLSGDKRLLNAFAEDRDIHQATAAEVLGIEPDEVSTEQRRSAKAVNFGLIYGMSAFGLARQLGIDRDEAQNYVDLYFARYPGVKEYMDNTRQQARDQGYVETVFGRRLYLPEIHARNYQRRQYAERSAINAPMQGTAADIIKRAMISVQDWLSNASVDARLIMQVHDELVLEVAEDKVDTVSKEVTKHMADAATLDVPLKVDVGSGTNWDEAH